MGPGGLAWAPGEADRAPEVVSVGERVALWRDLGRRRRGVELVSTSAAATLNKKHMI